MVTVATGPTPSRPSIGGPIGRALGAFAGRKMVESQAERRAREEAEMLDRMLFGGGRGEVDAGSTRGGEVSAPGAGRRTPFDAAIPAVEPGTGRTVSRRGSEPATAGDRANPFTAAIPAIESDTDATVSRQGPETTTRPPAASGTDQGAPNATGGPATGTAPDADDADLERDADTLGRIGGPLGQLLNGLNREQRIAAIKMLRQQGLGVGEIIELSGSNPAEFGFQNVPGVGLVRTDPRSGSADVAVRSPRELQFHNVRGTLIGVDPTTGQRARIARVPQDLEVESQFGAVDNESGQFMTVLRTNRGLFTQGVNEQGEPALTPVDSNRIRPVGTQVTGTADETALPDTEQRQLRDAEVATRNVIATTGDAIRLLHETPDINTFTARAAGVVNDLQAEGRALARAFGVEFDENLLDPSTHAETFDQLGIESARMQSLITSLAFQAAAASGQTGRSVSDRDVKRFITEIGAQHADPRAMEQVLRDVSERASRRFRTNFETRLQQPFEGSLGELPPPADVAGDTGAAGSAGAELPPDVPQGSRRVGTTFAGLPVYETPSGDRLVVE